MFINQQLTDQIQTTLLGLDIKQYDKSVRSKIETVVNELMLPYKDQYDLTKLQIRVNYYYQEKQLDVKLILNDQQIKINLNIKE